MLKTLDRLLSYEKQAVYLTHFGRVINIQILSLELCQCLHQLVEMTLELIKKGKAQQEQLSAGVSKIFKDRLRKHNC